MAKDAKPFEVDMLHLQDVRIISGSIDSPFEFDRTLIKSYHLDMQYDTGFNRDENMVKSDFTITVNTESSEKQTEASGSFQFAFIFGVENLKELVVPESVESTNLTVDGKLSMALASVTYSTARGILLTRFKGTVLEEFILPIIQPAKLLEL